MRNLNLSSFRTLFIAGTLVALSNCGKSNSTSDVTVNNSAPSSPEPRQAPAVVPTSTGGPSRGSGTNFGLRQCTDKVTNLSPSFEEFTHTQVVNLEGDVTLCLDKKGSGNSLQMHLRMEWEDNIGVRYYPDNFAGSQYKRDKLQLVYADFDPAATEIYFMDIEGFVAIRGAVAASRLLATIDYVDIVPFERDPSGEPLLDVNGDPTTDYVWGPHNQCRSEEYLDAASAPVFGFFKTPSMALAEDCITNFNIPHSLYDYDFNLEAKAFTPTPLSSYWTQVEEDNLLGMLRRYFDPANKTALEALKVRQGTVGDIDLPEF